MCKLPYQKGLLMVMRDFFTTFFCYVCSINSSMNYWLYTFRKTFDSVIVCPLVCHVILKLLW